MKKGELSIHNIIYSEASMLLIFDTLLKKINDCRIIHEENLLKGDNTANTYTVYDT